MPQHQIQITVLPVFLHRAIERAGFEVSPDVVRFYANGRLLPQAIRDVLEYVQGGPDTNEVMQSIGDDYHQLMISAMSGQ